MKSTHSAYRLITVAAWLTAYAWSPAAQSTPANAGNADKPAVAKSPAAKPPIDYLFDETPLDRANKGAVASYSDMLDKVTPAVVGIYPSRRMRQAPVPNGSPFGGPQGFGQYGYQYSPQGPQVPGYPRGNGQPQAPKPDWADANGNYRYLGAGSGCIISSDGYILTNHHVVVDERSNRPIQALLVKLQDGREFQAKVVGSDALTDLALLKIDAKNLPTIKMADSDKSRVGDVVFAIGNPMDVGLTVSHGIISALGRSELNLINDDPRKENGYEDFIQTDAPINPGNSGGPLVDAEGRLVGLDSAIFSTSDAGGSIGIGFAIPSVLARHVADELMTNGKVRRGFLGVGYQEIDQNNAKALGLASPRGALINKVGENTPAATAGVKNGDVVLKINNNEVDSPDKLRYLIALADPGTTVDLTVFRDGQPKLIKVMLGDHDQNVQTTENVAQAWSNARPAPVNARPGRAPGEILPGVSLSSVTPDVRQNLSLPANVNGLVVTDVAQNSPLSYEFHPGTIIAEVNKKPVTSLDELKAQLKPGGLNMFYVLRDGVWSYVTETLDNN